MGTLKPGDVILAINGQSLEYCNLREAAHALRNAGDVVTLTISKECSEKPATGRECLFVCLFVVYMFVSVFVCLFVSINVFMCNSLIVTASEAVIFSVELHSNGAPLGISLTGIYILSICTIRVHVWHCICVYARVWCAVCGVYVYRMHEGICLFTFSSLFHNSSCLCWAKF